MEVLISGGIKTSNIVNPLKNRFSSGGVEIIMEENLVNIENVLNRGERFDRAIIMEQSWTKDGEITDIAEIRKTIADFCDLVHRRCKQDTICFFVTKEEEMAKILAQETISLYGRSLVLLKQPPYAVIFFTDMITRDIKNINKEWIYELKDEEDTGIKSEVEWSSEGTGIEENIGFGEILKGVKDVEVNLEDLLNEEDTLEEDTFEEDTFEEDTFEEELEELEDLGEESIDEIEEIDEMEEDSWWENGEDNEESWGELEEDFEEGYIEENIEDSLEELESLEEEIDKAENNMEELEKRIEKLGDKITQKESEKSEKFTGSNKKELIEREKSKEEKVKVILDYYNNRGGTLIVTGAGGCGTSTIASNLANTVANLGYTVLLVDYDTKWRTQAYINRNTFDAVHTYSRHSAYLMSALGSQDGASKYASITRPGLHVLTMGLIEEIIDYSEIAESFKINMLDTNARTNYNFIIYDVPFEVLNNYGETLINNADNILWICDSSNWGLMKMILSITNIENTNSMDAIYRRSKVLFNRFRGIDKILGEKVNNLKDVMISGDNMIKEIIGYHPDLLMQEMKVIGKLDYIEAIEQFWYSRKYLSDIPEGKEIFVNLLNEIFNN